MRKTIIALAAASSLLALGATAAQAAVKPKPNATPACGAQCIDIFSRVLGHHTILNAYVPGDTGVGGKVGQKLNLKFASNSHPNEDFTLAADGTVSQFCGTELAPTSVACIHYASSEVLELNWTPFGNETDLCAGTSGTIFSGENVTLQQCGVYEGTLFIVDSDNTQHGYSPLIDGASASFSHPEVVTVDPGTAHPTNQIKVETENTLTGGVIPDSQLFLGFPGPVA
ncbi:MAG: hypothetical protein ACRDPO_12250 [Streptosporangiaceae bacterium]